MPFTPFHIFCTTCQAKLLVRQSSLLGQLLACPKCQSMVYIEAPQTEPTQEEPSVDVPQPEVAQKPETPPPTPQAPPEPEEETPLIRKRPNHYANQSGRIILCSMLIGVAVLLAVVYIAMVKRSDSSPPDVAVERVVTQPVPVEATLNEKIAQPESEPEESLSLAPVPIETTEPMTEIDEKNSHDPEILSTGENSDNEAIAETVSDDLNPENEKTGEIAIGEEGVKPATAPQPIPDRPMIHVEERLRIPIKGLESDKTTLYQAVQFLSAYSGIPMTWDVPGMRLFDISLDKPIRLRFTDTTVGEALTLILQQNQLTFLVDHSQIFVYPQAAADPTLKELKYDISDLVRPVTENGPQLTVKQLLEGIPLLVAPLSWTLQEKTRDLHLSEEMPHATGTIRAEGSVLSVVQTDMNHRELFRLLEMIRTAKKIPLKSGATPEKIIPEHFAYGRLDQHMTFHYMLETPLSDMLDMLSQTAKLKILVNHRVLNSEQVPFDSLSGTVHVENGTVRDALNELLKSVNVLEMAYRIVDGNAVEITSYDSLFSLEMQSLESHFYGAKLRSQGNTNGGNTAESMVEMLKSSISPDSWSETTWGGGAVLIDHASETFFVRQSQSVQQIIREWLKEQP